MACRIRLLREIVLKGPDEVGRSAVTPGRKLLIHFSFAMTPTATVAELETSTSRSFFVMAREHGLAQLSHPARLDPVVLHR